MKLYRQRVLDRRKGWVTSWHTSYTKADEWRREYAKSEDFESFEQMESFEVERKVGGILRFLNELEEERVSNGD